MNELVAWLKFGGAMVAILLVVIALVNRPLRDEAGLLTDEIRSLVERCGNEAGDRVWLQRADRRLREMEARAERELKQIPASASIPTLYESLTTRINELPLGERSIKGGRDGAVGGTLSHGVDVSTSGDFHGVYELIRHVEELPRLVRVRKVKLKSMDTRGTGRVSASVHLDAYYRPRSNHASASGGSGR